MNEQIPNSMEEEAQLVERVIDVIGDDRTLRDAVKALEGLFVGSDRVMPETIGLKIDGQREDVSISILQKALHERHPEWKKEDVDELFED
jgi:hypothetical protein